MACQKVKTPAFTTFSMVNVQNPAERSVKNADGEQAQTGC